MKDLQAEKHLSTWIHQGETNNNMGVLFFETKWSGNSGIMRSILSGLTAKYGSQIDLASCDLDELPNLAAEYQICEVPTIMFFFNGKVQVRFEGLIPKHELATHIHSFLTQFSTTFQK